MKRQGASKGACLAFLISTPETGVDSIALTYSLLDPVMTVLRPVIALVTGVTAGVIENSISRPADQDRDDLPTRACPVDGCCDGTDCDPQTHAGHHTMREKLRAGIHFAFGDLMKDLASWFVIGCVIAGAISALVPESLLSGALGTGIVAYAGILVVSLPMYVCASMSTPIAAALIMKGLSPGAALVFLLAGPATNMATITMVGGLLGKRTLAVYVGSIIVCTLLAAYLTDLLYAGLGISAGAAVGAAASELLPAWIEWTATGILGALVLYHLGKSLPTRIGRLLPEPPKAAKGASALSCGCCDEQPGKT